MKGDFNPRGVKAAYDGLVEFSLDLSEEPVEGLGAEPELLGHAARAERAAQVDVEEQRGVLLRLPTQGVLAVHNHQLLAQLVGTCKHRPDNETCILVTDKVPVSTDKNI